MNSKVAVIILNWNGREDTLECLDAVYKMNYYPFEVIVVDNGSNDDSVPAIRERFKDVLLIENKANLVFCGGYNIGIKYALGRSPDYLHILNNDADWGLCCRESGLRTVLYPKKLVCHKVSSSTGGSFRLRCIFTFSVTACFL